MLLTLPPGAFAAYLFDCDGTIADSMPLHYRAWSAALAPYGCTFPEPLFYAWGGRPVADILHDLARDQHLDLPIAHLTTHKEDLYLDLLPELQPVPDVLEHILAAHGTLPFAVVSGSTRESVAASLASLNLTQYFPTLVCAGDYTHPKPHPEPFLRAAELLGVPAAQCLVFEDTDMGIESALAAGMKAIKVPNPEERQSRQRQFEATAV